MKLLSRLLPFLPALTGVVGDDGGGGTAPGARLELRDDEWRARLSPESYAVLRHEATERPHSSALNDEHRRGTFVCAGCGQSMFRQDSKFDAGCGWPSFFEALPGAFETKTDHQLARPRVEYHCSGCGGHHGHVFEDGPQPTGQRFCNNGLALKFVPDEG